MDVYYIFDILTITGTPDDGEVPRNEDGGGTGSGGGGGNCVIA
jgi:hypothetical protein